MDDFIETPTIISAEEAAVLAMRQESIAALEGLKSAAISVFKRLWDEPPSRAGKLAVMGTKAVAKFQQHARTIQYLLESGVEMDPEDYTPPVPYTAHEDGTITLD